MSPMLVYALEGIGIGCTLGLILLAWALCRIAATPMPSPLSPRGLTETRRDIYKGEV